MFLRSLTMRGFKSFAERTVLEVEPGITVIVGPNGSGKSNVVDALSWVLGTHSVKKVRGGAMSDVIFAGSPTRARASQARVEITIDNSDGRLRGSAIGSAASAAEFAEVTIGRTIQADGETAYELNGEQVRALDVQELLSDTGLGRELHTIVGQGQLDEILNAKPEERRRTIEEAAGILKHRRRRERALRKLEQVEGHIDKLATVLRELRRQLRPLERQAEAADRHAALQAELREVRGRLAAVELGRLQTLLARDGADGEQLRDELAASEQQLTADREREDELRAAVAGLVQRAEQAQATASTLASLRERMRGTNDLIEAKRRHLVEAVEEAFAGRPPVELRDQATRVDAEVAQRAEIREVDRARLVEASTGRREAEQARRHYELEREAERQRRAEHRERVLRFEGEVAALRGTVASVEAELDRTRATLAALDARIVEIQGEVDGVLTEIQQLDTSEVELTAELEAGEQQVAAADREVERLAAAVRELQAEQASSVARAEALRAALAERDGGSSALLASGLGGLLGAVADYVRVELGHDAAIAAALGPLGEAVAVTSSEQGRRAVAWLREGDEGAAVVLPVRRGGGAPVPPTEDQAGMLDVAGARPVGDLLAPADDGETAAEVVAALRQVLGDTWLVADWDTAVLLHGRLPHTVLVTAEGDVAGPRGLVAGGSPERSAVLTATAAEEAEQRAEVLGGRLERLEAQRRAADAARVTAKRRLAQATERINESDARITGAAERLARLHRELTQATSQHGVVAGQLGELEAARERDAAALAELAARGPEPAPEPESIGTDAQAAALDAEVEAARERELDAHVRLERTTEQVRHLESRADALRREADEVEVALAEAARRRELRRQGIVRCGELAAVATASLEALERSADAAEHTREALREQLGDRRRELAEVRAQLTAHATALDALREQGHATDLRRAEHAARLEQLTARIRAELSLTPDELRAEHPDPSGEDPAALSEREDVLVRRIGLLGRVNPLALEEFRALEQRHAFLSEQLDDLRRSKRDLGQVVVAVDERIREVFRAAFEDVAREFELTFATVFPGGHGRLLLTGDDDLLTAGVDVEARLPGKKVTRLSLLSGGERSLTVLAFVFAIFRARPSPFYVLDEVDAALDDVNLQRLLKVVRSFRGQAQIILVTHQKRSMEIADMLYGVTMGPDAVTKVVAERLREAVPADLEARASNDPTQALVLPADPTLA